MKNAFYFTLKALSVLKIFKLLSWLFVHVVKQLDKKDKFNLKFMPSQPVSQTIAMYILTNISRSKGNQKMKFGQLIEHTIGKCFSWKIIHKMWWRNYSQTLSKKSNLIISLDQLPKDLYSLFLLYAKLRTIEIY